MLKVRFLPEFTMKCMGLGAWGFNWNGFKKQWRNFL